MSAPIHQKYSNHRLFETFSHSLMMLFVESDILENKYHGHHHLPGDWRPMQT